MFLPCVKLCHLFRVLLILVICTEISRHCSNAVRKAGVSWLFFLIYQNICKSGTDLEYRQSSQIAGHYVLQIFFPWAVHLLIFYNKKINDRFISLKRFALFLAAVF